jgi:hypothetical protein
MYTPTRPAGGLDISSASYDSVSVSVSANISTGVTTFQFKPDGTKLFILDGTDDDVSEYALSTAWDITTATFTRDYSFSGLGLANPTGLNFDDDGSQMYLIQASSAADIYEFTLSSNWDLSSVTSLGSQTDVSTQLSSPRDMFISPDGTKMYVIGVTTDAIFQYSLSPAWDISSASYDSISLSVSARDIAPSRIHFSNDGKKLLVFGLVSEDIFQYTLSTAWDLSTATYDSILFAADGQEATPRDVAINTDETKMYIIGTGRVVYQYSL